MDRRKVYPGQGVLDEDFLSASRFAYIGLGRLAQAALGNGPVASGFAIAPGAGLSVNLGAGELYVLTATDAGAYGSLPASAFPILKQAILPALVNLALGTPAIGGQARTYLIQARLLESDTGETVLPYYNVSNPSAPWTGPNNDGSTNTTTRNDAAQVQAKAGVDAVAGRQLAPAPDAGWIGLYTVTTRNGQAAIVPADIRNLIRSPVLRYSLPQVPRPANAHAFARGDIL